MERLGRSPRLFLADSHDRMGRADTRNQPVVLTVSSEIIRDHPLLIDMTTSLKLKLDQRFCSSISRRKPSSLRSSARLRRATFKWIRERP